MRIIYDEFERARLVTTGGDAALMMMTAGRGAVPHVHVLFDVFLPVWRYQRRELYPCAHEVRRSPTPSDSLRRPGAMLLRLTRESGFLMSYRNLHLTWSGSVKPGKALTRAFGLYPCVQSP